MNLVLVLARTVHIGSAMLLFGDLVFLLAIAGPVWRRSAPQAESEARQVRGWCLALARGSLVVSFAAALAWLAAEAVAMSGLPPAQAIGRETIALVLFSTTFGRVWSLRLGLAIILYALVRRAGHSNSHAENQPAILVTVVAASVYLATLALAGHAAAGDGSDRWVQLAIDMLHLLAAGAWVGALPGLVFALRTEPLSTAASVTRRFSTLGMLCVSALTLTGFGNAWYLIGNLPALIATTYGQLLLVKLGLFAAMVLLAAVNRLRLTPRLQDVGGSALRALRRNATLEIAAGAMVVAIVGALGITIPGTHQPIVWPLAWTLSFEPVHESTFVGTLLVVAGVTACVAAVIGAAGLKRRVLRPIAVATTLLAVSALASMWSLAVPAHPTTYAESPVPYATAAIAQGARNYAQYCRDCHGANGRGDGPAAASLRIAPPNLTEHAAHHRVGDLFWWIAHGIPGSPMPAFEPPLAANEIWSLVQYLRAHSAAADAQTINGDVGSNAVMAPDFTFEAASMERGSLERPGSEQATLLVLYSLPESLPRLRELASLREQPVEHGVRVVAIPIDGKPVAPEMQKAADMIPILAKTTPDVATTYATFARRAGETDRAPLHAELLIDRQGYLRARWLDVPTPGADRAGDIAAQVGRLTREHIHPAPAHHMH